MSSILIIPPEYIEGFEVGSMNDKIKNLKEMQSNIHKRDGFTHMQINVRTHLHNIHKNKLKIDCLNIRSDTIKPLEENTSKYSLT